MAGGGVFYKSSDPNSFSWARLIVAVVLLGGVLAAAILTAGNDDLDALNTALVHGFELVLGVVLGLITGETASRN